MENIQINLFKENVKVTKIRNNEYAFMSTAKSISKIFLQSGLLFHFLFDYLYLSNILQVTALRNTILEICVACIQTSRRHRYDHLMFYTILNVRLDPVKGAFWFWRRKSQAFFPSHSILVSITEGIIFFPHIHHYFHISSHFNSFYEVFFSQSWFVMRTAAAAFR